MINLSIFDHPPSFPKKHNAQKICKYNHMTIVIFNEWFHIWFFFFLKKKRQLIGQKIRTLKIHLISLVIIWWFKYTFSPQYLPHVLKWSSSFEMFYFSFYTFNFCVKKVHTVTFGLIFTLQIEVK